MVMVLTINKLKHGQLQNILLFNLYLDMIFYNQIDLLLL